MGEHRGSYRREEFVYRERGYRRDDGRTNVGLADDPVVAKLLGLPDVPASGRLLELGCGDGNGTVHLAKWPFRVVGVDISPTAIAMAQQRLTDLSVKNAEAQYLDATTLDGLDDASFDLAIDSGCLHCIVDLDDRRATLSSVARVLKPGGSLLGVTQAQPFVKPVDSADTRLEGEVLWTLIDGAVDWGPSRVIRPKEVLLAEFAQAGLNIAWSEHRQYRSDWFCWHLQYHLKKPLPT